MQTMLHDPAILNTLIYILAAAGGQVLFAVSQWARGEIECVMDRFRHNPRATLAALIGNLTAIIGVMVALPLADMPLQAVVITAFFQGISADSLLNKNARKVWSEEERAAAGVDNAAKAVP